MELALAQARKQVSIPIDLCSTPVPTMCGPGECYEPVESFQLGLPELNAKLKSMKKSIIHPNTMKLLFLYSDPKLLRRLMARPFAAQNVVIPCKNRSELISLIAANEPHLVVIAGDHVGSAAEEIEASLRNMAFHTRILVLPGECADDQHLDATWLSLRSCSREPLCVEFDSEHYTVLSAKSFEPTGTSSGMPVDDSGSQEDRVLALLATGAMHHAPAQAYLSAVIATQRNYEREWSSAVLSGNAAAYLWRAQVFRLLSALAHYIPGVDTECLPLPHPPARSFDFLPTALSPEGFYALKALRAFGINSAFAGGLWSAGQIEVKQGPHLPGEAAQLAGWSALLREIAIVHIRVIDACLADHPAQSTAFQDSRHSRNLQGIFCRWWRITDFSESPGEILRLAKEFHSGRRAVGIKSFCSFYEFAQQLQQHHQAESPAGN